MIQNLVAILFGLGVNLRNWLFDRRCLTVYRSSIPVVSVGNLSVGGNGKTPLVIYLARSLKARGWSPVILSRGYGGTVRGPHRVTSSDGAKRVGDEPLLISRLLGSPVVVARSRVEGARLIEKDQLGDVIILDDGFQHRWLYRSVDILTAFTGTGEARDAFANAQLLPAGRFRELPKSALSRASCLVLAERAPQQDPTTSIPHELRKSIPGALPVFRSYSEVSQVANREGKSLSPSVGVGALCALGQPEGFLASLAHLGYSVQERFLFADHHPFCAEDLLKIRRSHPSLPLVCTEKDWVKLESFADQAVYVVRAELKVVPDDAFLVLIERALMHSRGS